MEENNEQEKDEQQKISVFVVTKYEDGPQDGAIYELKVHKEGAGSLYSQDHSSLEALHPVTVFFDKSLGIPADCMFAAARLGVSKLYLTVQGTPWVSPDGFPTIPLSFVFDTDNLKPISPITLPEAAKPSGVFLSAYGRLYYFTRVRPPYRGPHIANQLPFECYNPATDYWRPLPPCPYQTELRHTRIYGHAVCFGYIVISLYDQYERKHTVVAFHIETEKWHLVQVCKSAEAKRLYPFQGRAVVLDGLLYAPSRFGKGLVAFSFSRDSDGNCFLGTPMSFQVKDTPRPPWPLRPLFSQSLNQVGRQHLCLIQTGMNLSSYKHQYVCATTFQIVRQGEAIGAETLSSYVFRFYAIGYFSINLSFTPFCVGAETLSSYVFRFYAIGYFSINLSFTPDYEDNEPEEKDCPTVPAKTESSWTLGDNKGKENMADMRT